MDTAISTSPEVPGSGNHSESFAVSHRPSENRFSERGLPVAMDAPGPASYSLVKD